MTYRVAGIGEILWDRFPEADRLGGAPANFAFHTGQLGASPHVISRTGRDLDGDRIAGLLEERGLSGEFIQRDPSHHTGVVQVKLAHGEPSYVIESPAAWDYLELNPALTNLAPTLDAVCFGTLAQRCEISRQTIQKFIRLCSPQTLRLFDINLRQSFHTRETIEQGLSLATALKLNGEELGHLTGLFGWPSEPETSIAALFQSYSVKWIAVTKGADGCEIHTRERAVRSPAPAVNCVDAVGAGDAFSAVFVLGFLWGWPLEKIADHANRVGAYVASQPGAMPLLPGNIKNL